MKKAVCFFLFLAIGFSVFGIEHSLNGSWGHGSSFVIRFNSSANEINIGSHQYRSNQIRIVDENTIAVNLPDGDIITIQYHLFTPTKGLFIITDRLNQKTDTFILKKF
uniref:Uncharacterized protein n=1 Tax=uncultured bacterium contig00003 TaxID=1181495 RepID=A0A806KGL7_9BACT|nr:hypothetical protein [uncultured bacterium contig00003]